MADIDVRDVILERDGQLQVDGLPFRAGERVKVLVMRPTNGSSPKGKYPLSGAPLRYDNPFDPAIDADAWEANS